MGGPLAGGLAGLLCTTADMAREPHVRSRSLADTGLHDTARARPRAVSGT